jgi:predicted RNase H-like HicB family nuclease
MVEGPNGEEIIWQDGNYDTPTIKLEDARLIAAAPDLLEALQHLMVAHGEQLDYAFQQAQEAIAKATGEQNGN